MRVDRPDKPYVASMLKSMYTAGLVILGLVVVCIGLILLVIVTLRQPRLVTVIEKNTGKTYATMSQSLTEDLLERQLIYYTRQFVEDFLTLDYSEIDGARKRAMEIMHPKLRAEIGSGWLNDDNVKMSRAGQLGTEFDWSIKPTITLRNDPLYNVFVQVKRKITRKGYKPVEEQFDMLLKWGRLQGGVEPFQRPHQLVLLEQQEISKNQSKLNEQLNLIYK